MHTYPYPRPALTADIVLFGVSDEGEALRVLLVTRKNEPFQGMRAFPGGFVNVSDDGDQGEPPVDAARRELKEETGLVVRGLHVIGLASAPGRDPRGRVISVLYTGLVRLAEVSPQAGDDAASVEWVAPAEGMALAFDHAEILRNALCSLNSSLAVPENVHLLPKHLRISDIERLGSWMRANPWFHEEGDL
jgi:8-oxo-dGTP diphosphatase